MEEKLYFKPETARKTKNNKDSSKKKKDYKVLKLVSFLLFLVIIVLVIIWLLKGSKTVSGRYPENVKNEYLDCVSEKFTYSKVGEVGDEKKELRATMVFFGEEELSSISIKYTLRFKDKQAAGYAEPIISTRFHENIAQVVDSYSAFNNKVTLLDETVTVALHASKNDLTDLAKEFFLVKKTEELASLADFRKSFEAQGFTCEASINKN